MQQVERTKDQVNVLGMHACTQSVASMSENSSVMSVSLNLPARCAGLCMGQPEGLESPTDASNTCMDTQSIANDSQRLTNKIERTRTPQIG